MLFIEKKIKKNKKKYIKNKKIEIKKNIKKRIITKTKKRPNPNQNDYH